MQFIETYYVLLFICSFIEEYACKKTEHFKLTRFGNIYYRNKLTLEHRNKKQDIIIKNFLFSLIEHKSFGSCQLGQCTPYISLRNIWIISVKIDIGNYVCNFSKSCFSFFLKYYLDHSFLLFYQLTYLIICLLQQKNMNDSIISCSKLLIQKVGLH